MHLRHRGPSPQHHPRLRRDPGAGAGPRGPTRHSRADDCGGRPLPRFDSIGMSMTASTTQPTNIVPPFLLVGRERAWCIVSGAVDVFLVDVNGRSEEHTSEL